MKKFLSLLLVCLMLLPAVVACNKKDDLPNDTDTGAASSESKDVIPSDSKEGDETEKLLRYDEDGFLMDNLDLKGVDLEGKEISILTGNDKIQYYYAESLSPSADPLSSAVFTRHMTVQKRLNCKLNYTTTADTYDDRAAFTKKVLELSTAGDLDLVGNYSVTSSNIMMNGLYADLKQSQMLELDQPWWNQEIVNGCAIYDKLYFASGDISPLLIKQSFIYLYNKDMYAKISDAVSQQYGVKDVYEMVNEGDWTYENMFAIANLVIEDADGRKNMDDTFGYVAYAMAFDCYYSGCGLKQLEKNTDGSIKVSDDMTSVKANDLMKMLYDFLNSKAAVAVGDCGDCDPVALWGAGKALFYNGRVFDMHRNVGFEVGLLPAPKYDTDQENYLTVPGFGYTMWGVMRSSNTDYEELCAVLECLASEGYRKVTPAYFDTTLAGRQETKNDYDMLYLIRANVVIDAGRVVDEAFKQHTWDVWRKSIASGNSFATQIESVIRGMNEQATSLNSLMKNMEKIYG